MIVNEVTSDITLCGLDLRDGGDKLDQDQEQVYSALDFICVFAFSQVLITIYWLGRKAHLDAYYSGPQLNFKAFEGLLGLALSKVSHSPKPFTVCSHFY